MGGSNKDSASPSAEFDKELFGILSEKLPISSSRISSLTKLALHKYGKVLLLLLLLIFEVLNILKQILTNNFHLIITVLQKRRLRHRKIPLEISPRIQTPRSVRYRFNRPCCTKSRFNRRRRLFSTIRGENEEYVGEFKTSSAKGFGKNEKGFESLEKRRVLHFGCHYVD